MGNIGSRKKATHSAKNYIHVGSHAAALEKLAWPRIAYFLAAPLRHQVASKVFLDK